MAHRSPWQWPDDHLPPKVQALAEWTVAIDKGDLKTRRDWCRANDVNYETAGAWLRDPRVRAEIDKLASELNMRPDRIQEVIESVFRAAKNGDMKAAQLYLQHVDRLAPKRTIVEDRRIEQLSEAEFQAELEKHGLVERVGLQQD